ncbi:hypothetical protein ASF48_10290 [Rathayibacter sp. Leaf299]|nr:hypothetical protein ASF48_10290 [Rathayibacter sp. Leaf299]
MATNSSVPPRRIHTRRSERIAPAPATTATAIPAISERRATAGRSRAVASCSIATHAEAKPSTAALVWIRSCQLKLGPTGSGQPAVQVTCEARAKHADASRRASAGGRAGSSRVRTARAPIATAVPPAATRSSAACTTPAVGMSGAPISLT